MLSRRRGPISLSFPRFKTSGMNFEVYDIIFQTHKWVTRAEEWYAPKQNGINQYKLFGRFRMIQCG